MKIFIRILIVLGILIVLVLIGGMFLPSKLHVQRSAVIKANPSTVYSCIANLKNWPSWSPWQRMDPGMKIDYFGPESGIGSGYNWTTSNGKVGTGTITITEAKQDEDLKFKMAFTGMGANTAHFEIKQVDEGTELTWSMDGSLGRNPLKHYLSLMMDKLIGPDFEKGLHNIDSVCQHMPMPTDSAHGDFK